MQTIGIFHKTGNYKTGLRAANDRNSDTLKFTSDALLVAQQALKFILLTGKTNLQKTRGVSFYPLKVILKGTKLCMYNKPRIYCKFEKLQKICVEVD